MPRESPAATAIEEVIRRAVVPELKPLGFRRAGRTFRRTLRECIQVVNVQSSRWNDAREGQFTLNLGVYFPAAHAEMRDLLRWSPGTAGPTEPECTVRRRIGRLLPSNLDKWWTVRPAEPSDRVVEEVRALLRDPALPWVERVSTLAGARAEADGGPAIALSLLLGDLEAARRLAERALAESPRATALHAWTRARGLLP